MNFCGAAMLQQSKSQEMWCPMDSQPGAAKLIPKDGMSIIKSWKIIGRTIWVWKDEPDNFFQRFLIGTARWVSQWKDKHTTTEVHENIILQDDSYVLTQDAQECQTKSPCTLAFGVFSLALALGLAFGSSSLASSFSCGFGSLVFPVFASPLAAALALAFAFALAFALAFLSRYGSRAA